MFIIFYYRIRYHHCCFAQVYHISFAPLKDLLKFCIIYHGNGCNRLNNLIKLSNQVGKPIILEAYAG